MGKMRYEYSTAPQLGMIRAGLEHLLGGVENPCVICVITFTTGVSKTSGKAGSHGIPAMGSKPAWVRNALSDVI
jgi:hypothetical protein